VLEGDRKPLAISSARTLVLRRLLAESSQLLREATVRGSSFVLAVHAEDFPWLPRPRYQQWCVPISRDRPVCLASCPAVWLSNDIGAGLTSLRSFALCYNILTNSLWCTVYCNVWATGAAFPIISPKNDEFDPYMQIQFALVGLLAHQLTYILVNISCEGVLIDRSTLTYSSIA